MTPTIRRFHPSDSSACHATYVDAVRNGTAPHYTPEQAKAWAPATVDDGEWTHRLETGDTWVGEADGMVQGFITMRKDGHLDLFFVRPAARPSGLARALYDAMIADIAQSGQMRLSTDASLLARSFLEKRGWQATGKETVTRHGVSLTRFPMMLDLPPTSL